VLSVRSNCVLLFAGDPYFVEYLEPFAAYEMTVRARAMSEVGDGYPLKYVATTPDAQTHTHTHTHRVTERRRGQLENGSWTCVIRYITGVSRQNGPPGRDHGRADLAPLLCNSMRAKRKHSGTRLRSDGWSGGCRHRPRSQVRVCSSYIYIGRK